MTGHGTPACQMVMKIEIVRCSHCVFLRVGGCERQVGGPMGQIKAKYRTRFLVGYVPSKSMSVTESEAANAKSVALWAKSKQSTVLNF
jgi:hypothetical protein